LKEKNVGRVYVVGLAYDYCVGWTAVDAKKNGFETYVVKDLSRGISEETTKEMERRFEELGIYLVNSYG
jgi:nicotinamidase-related amidase